MQGVLSIAKARVDGIDKDVTKTGEDRRIATLFCKYAAWIEGALEADIAAIREARNRMGGDR
jgi:hypothetical protein